MSRTLPNKRHAHEGRLHCPAAHRQFLPGNGGDAQRHCLFATVLNKGCPRNRQVMENLRSIITPAAPEPCLGASRASASSHNSGLLRPTKQHAPDACLPHRLGSGGTAAADGQNLARRSPSFGDTHSHSLPGNFSGIRSLTAHGFLSPCVRQMQCSFALQFPRSWLLAPPCDSGRDVQSHPRSSKLCTSLRSYIHVHAAFGGDG